MNMKKMDNTPLFFISAAKRGFFDPPFFRKKVGSSIYSITKI